MPDSTPFIVFAFECRVVGSNRATEGNYIHDYLFICCAHE